MSLKDKLLKELRDSAKRERRAISLRIPVDIDEELQEIAKQTGAEYTKVLIKILRVGLDALKAQK